jgi:hypothetical protein
MFPKTQEALKQSEDRKKRQRTFSALTSNHIVTALSVFILTLGHNFTQKSVSDRLKFNGFFFRNIFQPRGYDLLYENFGHYTFR